MERLTKRNRIGTWTFYKDDGSVSFSGEHVDRLAAYENTGYMPEEIEGIANKGYDLQSLPGGLDELEAYRSSGLTPEEAAQLAAAKRQGLLLTLPCGVGDDIYIIIEHVTGRKSIAKNTCSSFTDKGILAGFNSFYPFSEIGKTIFLSYEEAEGALSS